MYILIFDVYTKCLKLLMFHVSVIYSTQIFNEEQHLNLTLKRFRMPFNERIILDGS